MVRKAAARVEEVEPVELSPIQAKFQTALKEIADKLIERDEVVPLFLVGLICHEHVCIQGPPGTAKSLLADSVLSFVDAPVYSELMMKDTPAEAVFGPLDIPLLTGQTTGKSEYVRLVDGYLPAAVGAFLDEVFKSGPAVLNRLLKIMNERRFRNKGQMLSVPLISLFSASNEWPNDQEGGKELAAFMDRYLLRANIESVRSPAGRQRLLWTRDHVPQLSVRVTEAELRQAKKEAQALPWEPKAKDTLTTILQALNKEGIVPGDRRQYKAVDVAAANAYLNGATQVDTEHLEILQHVLWVDPVEQPRKAAEIITKLANPLGSQIAALLLEAQTIVEGTNPGDLQESIIGTKKLEEIGKKLNKLKKTDKQKNALDFVEQSVRDLRMAAMQASFGG
jgi:MoxR-like ATPase